MFLALRAVGRLNNPWEYIAVVFAMNVNKESGHVAWEFLQEVCLIVYKVTLVL